MPVDYSVKSHFLKTVQVFNQKLWSIRLLEPGDTFAIHVYCYLTEEETRDLDTVSRV